MIIIIIKQYDSDLVNCYNSFHLEQMNDEKQAVVNAQTKQIHVGWVESKTFLCKHKHNYTIANQTKHNEHKR